MRQIGRLTQWDQAQGCGLITPKSGGDPVFVNIDSFTNRPRPLPNDIVDYKVSYDEQQRAHAEDVVFVLDQGPAPFSTGWGPGILAFAVFFMVFVAEKVWERKLPVSVLGFYMLASTIAFVIYRHEKAMSASQTWRISDNTLHFCSLVGGWPGAALAQKMVHHEPQKMSFRAIYWSTVVLNSFVFFWLLSNSGSEELRSLLNSLKIH